MSIFRDCTALMESRVQSIIQSQDICPRFLLPSAISRLSFEFLREKNDIALEAMKRNVETLQKLKLCTHTHIRALNVNNFKKRDRIVQTCLAVSDFTWLQEARRSSRATDFFRKFAVSSETRGHVESRFSSSFETTARRPDRRGPFAPFDLCESEIRVSKSIGRTQGHLAKYVSSRRTSPSLDTVSRRVSSRFAPLYSDACSPAVNCKRSFIPLVVTSIALELVSRSPLPSFLSFPFFSLLTLSCIRLVSGFAALRFLLLRQTYISCRRTQRW